MRYALAIALVCVPLAAAVYAHYRLPFLTPNRLHLWLTRLLLLAVGLGFGWAMSGVYLDVEGGAALLVFLGAFGLAHFPAAVILGLKTIRQRQIDQNRRSGKNGGH